ncbi:hypothetical protein PR048_021172 [Dryococelus australis]|uniref:Uncharacterized protein n=1 Tax=Dryococelus australis TaxID=614101 RepID=A0ABQ9GXG9_9NEOP|nr:hypothetical protein PR048_021172 [Dryococelus australis]
MTAYNCNGSVHECRSGTEYDYRDHYMLVIMGCGQWTDDERLFCRHGEVVVVVVGKLCLVCIYHARKDGDRSLRFTLPTRSRRRQRDLLAAYGYSLLHQSRLLASYQGEPGSIPGRFTPGFSQVIIVPDDAASRRIFSGISSAYFPAAIYSHLISPSSALKTSFSLIATTVPASQVLDRWLAPDTTSSVQQPERARGPIAAGGPANAPQVSLPPRAPACALTSPTLAATLSPPCGKLRDSRTVRFLLKAFQLTARLTPRQQGLIPAGSLLGFSHAGIVMDDASGRQVFSGISSFPPSLHPGAAPYSPRFNLIGSQNIVVKSRPNLFTHLLTTTNTCQCSRKSLSRNLFREISLPLTTKNQLPHLHIGVIGHQSPGLAGDAQERRMVRPRRDSPAVYKTSPPGKILRPDAALHKSGAMAARGHLGSRRLQGDSRRRAPGQRSRFDSSHCHLRGGLLVDVDAICKGRRAVRLRSPGAARDTRPRKYPGRGCGFPWWSEGWCARVLRERGGAQRYRQLIAIKTPARFPHQDGNTARLARRSDEALGVRVSVARIAPSLLDLERAERSSIRTQGRGKQEIPEKTPPTSGIVRHDAHLRKSGKWPCRRLNPVGRVPAIIQARWRSGISLDPHREEPGFDSRSGDTELCFPWFPLQRAVLLMTSLLARRHATVACCLTRKGVATCGVLDIDRQTCHRGSGGGQLAVTCEVITAPPPPANSFFHHPPSLRGWGEGPLQGSHGRRAEQSGIQKRLHP